MEKIRIITDSMTDVPKDFQSQYKIRTIPLSIIFGEDTYLDGEEIEPEEFYEKLSNTETLPTTAQVTPLQFQRAFELALEEGYKVICINASSKASGTCQSAMIAKETIGSEDIQVVDTMGLCMGAGLTVIETARFIEEGANLEEAVDFANKYSAGMKHIFTVDTITYLEKGGRIAPGKAMVANIFNIKPVLTVKNGLVEPLDKVRGSKKVIDKMIAIALEAKAPMKNTTVSIAHANDLKRAEALKEKIEEVMQPKEIIMANIGCTIGTHTGPGTLAIFFRV